MFNLAHRGFDRILMAAPDTKKIYRLATEVDTPLRATYAKDVRDWRDSLDESRLKRDSHTLKQTGNRLTFRPRLFIDALTNFQASLEEVTLVVTRDGIRIRSYIDERTPSSVLRTEVSIEASDFEEVRGA